MTQYMMLIYASSEEVASDDPSNQISKWIDFDRTLKESGVHVADHRLEDIDTATTVRVRDGETLISDGPFAETKEWLAGYYVLDCPTLDKALELAAKAPIVGTGSVELRPVMEVALPAERVAG
jgi:hypothetical protein